MAQGEGRTLEEAFDDYARHKSEDRLQSELNLDELTFRQGLEAFEEYHPVQIWVKTRPANQWVKAFKVSDSS
jgi:hypothetical protein